MSQRNIFFALFFSFLLMASAGFAASPPSETPGEYMDDSVITTKVKTAIMEEPTLKTMDIKVVTEKGVVMLSGAVSTQAQINKTGEITRMVKGVKSVKNDLRLK